MRSRRPSNIPLALGLGLLLLPAAGRAGEFVSAEKSEIPQTISADQLTVLDAPSNSQLAVPEDEEGDDLKAFLPVDPVSPNDDAPFAQAAQEDAPVETVQTVKATLVISAAKIKEGGRSVLETLYDSEADPPPGSGPGPADGANDPNSVFVLRGEKKQEAIQYAHAELPAFDFDYRAAAFDKDAAVEFARQEVEVAVDSKWTGRKLLEFLMTPNALDVGAAARDGLDLARMNMDLFGKSEGELHRILLEENADISRDRIGQWLTQARLAGLIYVVCDKKKGVNYWGIPQIVRDALGFHSVANPGSVQVASGVVSRLEEALVELAKDKDMRELPFDDSKFEAMARVARAAFNAGLIEKEKLYPVIWAKAKTLPDAEPILSAALLTLLKESRAMPWFDKAKALCAQAVSKKLLDIGEFQDVIGSVEPAPPTVQAPDPVGPSLTESIIALTKNKDMRTLSFDDPKFEAMVRVLVAARKDGVITPAQIDQIVPVFWTKAKFLPPDSAAFSTALLALLKESRGTAWFDAAKALCAQAVSDKRLDGQALKDALASL